jgi:catechol 2,3-dioxygenase-like lactoylglutathione lyase family enzyme
MTIRRLDMVEMYVNDWEEAVRWYTQVLGLQVAAREDDDRFCLLGFPDGGATLALFSGERTVDTSHHSRCQPAMFVDDLEATMGVLRDRGARFEGDMQDDPDEGYRLVRVLDPEDNVLIVYEWRTTGAS